MGPLAASEPAAIEPVHLKVGEVALLKLVAGEIGDERPGINLLRLATHRMEPGCCRATSTETRCRSPTSSSVP